MHDGHLHYAPWLWVAINLATGGAYVVIGSLIARGWPIQARFGALFAAFIVACGVHHLVHALPGLVHWPPGSFMALQVVTDITMTTVSVLTAWLVLSDWRRLERAHG